MDTIRKHAMLIATEHMRDWFSQDTLRPEAYQLKACGITLDYSHNLITTESLVLLAARCDELKLREKIQAMMKGEPVNHTENRAALHTALRDPRPDPIFIEGQDVKKNIRAARLQAEKLSKAISQRPITDIVHIGVGGSYWGPLCMHQALAHLPSRYRIHFVATIDPAELETMLAPLKAESTLFILASKSFTTHEMCDNAQLAKAWLSQEKIQSPENHFIAVTENAEAARAWGVPAEQILPIWEWVGGRFSAWSMIGLPIMLAYGFEVFDEVLAGAHAMDQHVISQPWLENMPVLLALIEYWYRIFFNFNTLAIIPYHYPLRSLIPHLQQLHMESLGKPSDCPTGTIVWGALGSNALHTFNQLLQQGTEIVPIDFILSQDACNKTPALANHCLGQRASLMRGDPSDNPYATLEGNRPSNLLILDGLSPKVIGSLLALYEHKVAVLAHLYGINAFDQFGVEYSKKLARDKIGGRTI
jgi:glucose-6-phosphate isomerase